MSNALSNNTDFYIKDKNHPRYTVNKIIEEDLINVIVQKLEVIIFTKKGDLYGDPYLGSDLEYYLWSTSIPEYKIKKELVKQINTYIPELNELEYIIDLSIIEGEYNDIMYISFKIDAYNINFILK